MEAYDITSDATGDRLKAFGIDALDRSALKRIRPLVDSAIGPALDRLYAGVRTDPALAKLFRDDAHIEHAKELQKKHWAEICEGRFDQAYIDRTKTVGEVHAAIGLKPLDYLGGYSIIIEELINQVFESYQRARGRRGGPVRLFVGGGDSTQMTQEISAMVKAMLVDIGLSVSVYRDRIAEKVEDKQSRLAFSLDKMTDALESISEGDLTVTVNTEEFSGYERLASAFNLAVANLSDLISETRRSADTIKSGSREVAQAADDLAKRTEQQAANLEQTATAVIALNETVRETAASATTTNDTVGLALKDAEAGGRVVSETKTAMTQIESSAREMSQIIGVIDEIAFQTNLLALNAGVEAARAGEAGKGFAVVASEVRTLAQRSAEAAKSIKALIGASSAHVNAGVELVQNTSDFVTRTIEAFGDVSEKVCAITTASQSQATNIEEINSAVSYLDQMTQQNAAMVEETSAAGASLANEADAMADQVAEFRLVR